MNSRQRRKIEAQQHNDAIAYERWLMDNTRGQRLTDRAKMFSKGRKTGLTRISALTLINLMSAQAFTRIASTK